MKTSRKLALAILGILLILIGTGGIYAYFRYFTASKPPVFSIPSNLGHVVYITGTYLITPDEEQILKTKLTKEDMVILDNPSPEQVSFAKDLKTNTNVGAIVNKTPKEDEAYSNFLLNSNKDVKLSSISLPVGTYQREQAGNILSANDTENALFGSTFKSIITDNVGKTITLLNITCKKSSVTCIDYLIGFQNSYSEYYINMLDSDENQTDILVDKLPQSIITSKTDGIPLFFWSFNALSSNFKQQSFQLAVSRKSDSKIIYRTGNIIGTNQGSYFIPLQDPSDTDFTFSLNTWYTYKNTALTNPIKSTYDYTFTYKAVDLQQVNASQNLVEMGWVSDWGNTSAIDSIKKNPKKWNTISPAWYSVQKDGSISTGKTNQELLALAKNNGIRVIPTISQFDPDVLSEALNQHLDAHVQAIFDVVANNNYAGIDLDYETTYFDDKELFKQFITMLSDKLHQSGKVLIFTARAKFSDEAIYAHVPETLKVQDYTFLADHVDELRIMAYDFTGKGGSDDGPVSPLIWDELILAYATQKAPAGKIVLGLPLYSYAWAKNNDKSKQLATIPTLALEGNDMIAIKQQTSTYKETFDTWNSESNAEFKWRNIDRIAHFLNARALNERMLLAKKYHIKGVIYWRVGNDVL